MMGPSHFGGRVSAGSFVDDGFVGRFSFDPQSFVSFCLALGAAPAYIGSAQIARRVGVAPTLAPGLVGCDSFRVPIVVCLLLGSRAQLTARLVFPWMFVL
jgi:hypothetical protein